MAAVAPALDEELTATGDELMAGDEDLGTELGDEDLGLDLDVDEGEP